MVKERNKKLLLNHNPNLEPITSWVSMNPSSEGLVFFTSLFLPREIRNSNWDPPEKPDLSLRARNLYQI